MKYESDGMIARRRRIIDTALDMMARNDGDFTMRDLAKESGVATGTLYNLFGGQDALVAEAVVSVFEQRVNAMVVEPDSNDIADIVRARNEAAFHEMERVPSYAINMARIYFTANANNPVRGKLHAIPKAGWISTLQNLQQEEAVHSWVNVDALVDEIISAQYAVVTRWAAGEFETDKLLDRTCFASFSLLVGALVGERHDQIKAAMQQISPNTADRSKTSAA